MAVGYKYKFVTDKTTLTVDSTVKMPKCVQGCECQADLRLHPRNWVSHGTSLLARLVMLTLSFPSRNFYNASIPTGRLHIHVKKYVPT